MNIKITALTFPVRTGNIVCPAVVVARLTSGAMKFRMYPAVREVTATDDRKAIVHFLPIIEFTAEMAAALVAGPVIKNTRAAPGDTPFAIRAAATGTDAVAQTYIGIPKRSIAIIERSVLSPKDSKKLAGIKVDMAPAATMPIISDPDL